MGISLVLVTILLVADLQMDLNMTQRGGHYVVPMHGKVTVNDNETDGVFSAFKKKFFEG